MGSASMALVSVEKVNHLLRYLAADYGGPLALLVYFVTLSSPEELCRTYSYSDQTSSTLASFSPSNASLKAVQLLWRVFRAGFKHFHGSFIGI